MNNSKTIEDLDDHMLTQILIRLPGCASVLACSPVNKRWCSLISDPKFAVHFSNHKKESSILPEPGSNIDDDEPPWTFIANMIDVRVDPRPHSVGNTSNNEAVFGSPKFSVGYLPSDFVIQATFKDLVLCSGPLTSGGDRVYYITNPVTEQWVALPPCPPIFNDEWSMKPWVGLVCQQPHDYTQNYKFRVVVIVQSPPPIYELLVYCSEIGEWKRFILIVSIKCELNIYDRYPGIDNVFQGVVCNEIIYLHQKFYFAAFNPFDVDETTATNTAIEAKVLPSLPVPSDVYLRESSGQLFIMHDPNQEYYVCYKKVGRAIEFPLMVWKLDLNQVPLIWKTTFEGSCTGNVDIIEPDPHSIYDISASNIGMHPYDEKLIYMHLWREEQLVLCDTRTRMMKPLKSWPGYYLKTFHRLELQWWPTSVPKEYPMTNIAAAMKTMSLQQPDDNFNMDNGASSHMTSNLVCQQPYEYTRDYNFRVVVISQCPAPVYKLLVYCSEIAEWKKFNLTVSIKPELAAQERDYKSRFQGAVCNGVIYLHQKLYFATFNPFDVDKNTDTTTIEAKVLPSLQAPVRCFLRESSGQRFIIHNPNKDYSSVYYRKHGRAIEFHLKVWKFDPNRVPLIWKSTFEEEQLVLCDTRTRLIKPLKSLPQFDTEPLDRLELQWWPTLVPKG
ncbi:hypothetical protein KSS87_017425 [Heliosperma pusillum]|nr:hypothetical protein KSS87_017425 [Heliosperma pusillum]